MKALEDDIAAWIGTWDDNPRPFTWTTKTAARSLIRGIQAAEGPEPAL
ncbi:hypothetical protein ACH4TV_30880 [Streptomyces sp. NPDC020898]